MQCSAQGPDLREYQQLHEELYSMTGGFILNTPAISVALPVFIDSEPKLMSSGDARVGALKR